ncbi:MAG: glycogen synthase GlgA [Verrucomicrobiota bacterium]
MNILFASSEISPYAHTGGLGDVLAGLPGALRSAGHSVSVTVPMYRIMHDHKEQPWRNTRIQYEVPVGNNRYRAQIWQGKTANHVRLFAIEEPRLFDRQGLYGDRYGQYPDNLSRFVFFSKAVTALSQLLTPAPQILHLHDWHCALVPVFIRHLALETATVFTIHNLAYQGIFSSQDFNLLGLPKVFNSPEILEYYGRLNLMKGGLVCADAITTVSPTYANEILTPAKGCGLDGVLKKYKHKLRGITNGMDNETWNPETDPHIPENYSTKHMKGKALCKRRLQEAFHLPVDENPPLFGIVTRLVEQKGLELTQSIVEEILRLGAQFILLGSGDASYENYFSNLAKDNPNQVSVHIGFDMPLSHLIEAGCDFFLMPSRFEPCGLSQLYSQRYGTIPIVHATGGLADTVQPWDDHALTGTGFVFKEFHKEAFLAQVLQGIRLRQSTKKWQTIRMNAMQQDFSWSGRIDEYGKSYEDALLHKSKVSN